MSLDVHMLVAASSVEYERTAVRLALSREELANTKYKLRQQQEGSPLFNPQLWMRCFEKGLELMWRHREESGSLTVDAACLA